jgi:hypothetical protein
MNYDQLLDLARHRVNYPELAQVVVDPYLFDGLREGLSHDDGVSVGRLGVRRSAALQSGWAVGLDHSGNVTRLWSPDGELAIPKGYHQFGRALIGTAWDPEEVLQRRLTDTPSWGLPFDHGSEGET